MAGGPTTPVCPALRASRNARLWVLTMENVPGQPGQIGHPTQGLTCEMGLRCQRTHGRHVDSSCPDRLALRCLDPGHTLLWAHPSLAGPPFLQEIWVSLPSRPEDKILLETSRFLGTLSLRKDFLGVACEQAQGVATKQDWCPGCPRDHLVLQRSQWPGQVQGEGWAGGEARTAILQAPDAKHS